MSQNTNTIIQNMTTTTEQISEDAQNHATGTGTTLPDLSGLYRVIDDQYIKSDAAQFAPAPTEGPPVTVDPSELMATPSPVGGGDWGGGGDDVCCCCCCCCE